MRFSKTKVLWVIGVLIVVTFAVLRYCNTAKHPVERGFSADLVMKLPPEPPMLGKAYFNPMKSRTEIYSTVTVGNKIDQTESRLTQVIISRSDKKLS